MGQAVQATLKRVHHRSWLTLLRCHAGRRWGLAGWKYLLREHVGLRAWRLGWSLGCPDQRDQAMSASSHRTRAAEVSLAMQRAALGPYVFDLLVRGGFISQTRKMACLINPSKSTLCTL